MLFINLSLDFVYIFNPLVVLLGSLIIHIISNRVLVCLVGSEFLLDVGVVFLLASRDLLHTFHSIKS